MSLNQEQNRDDRFKEILREQLGENGIQMFVNQSVLFVLALVMIVAVVIGAMASSLFSVSSKTVTAKDDTIIVNNRSPTSIVSLKKIPVIM